MRHTPLQQSPTDIQTSPGSAWSLIGLLAGGLTLLAAAVVPFAVTVVAASILATVMLTRIARQHTARDAVRRRHLSIPGTEIDIHV